MTIVRILQSAVDPTDIDKVRRLFADDVKPVLEAQAGCLEVQLLMSVDANAGGLVEGAAFSRWETKDAMETAMGSRRVSEAQVRVFELLRQEPVVRVFEVAEVAE
jgi:quinol monooxygenase YgiN